MEAGCNACSQMPPLQMILDCNLQEMQHMLQTSIWIHEPINHGNNMLVIIQVNLKKDTKISENLK